MLEPHDRRLLLESLRPPHGYVFDRAIGTTFSLDLLALLTAPVAFTFFDAEESDTPAKVDLLAVLASVRKHIGNIAIFCQRSQIQPPSSNQMLYGYLEDAVIEVSPKKGVFHPKVWLLRYKQDDKVRYRLLCLSRNLTFDRSWDTILVLEGDLLDRKNALGSNHPLGDFIAGLPRIAIRSVPPVVAEMIERMRHEVRRVRFEPPEGFEKVVFWPMGVGGASNWPFENVANRSLIVAPFLTPSLLNQLTPNSNGHTLISRQESLDELPASVLDRFESVYVLSETTAPEPTDDEVEGVSNEILDGLHAKLYVFDDGWNAHVFTGSANATNAAFNGNVEFLIELVGKRSKCGVDHFLRDGPKDNSFVRLLAKYSRPPAPVQVDPSRKRLEQLLEKVIAYIYSAGLLATVEAADGGTFRLRLGSEGQ